MSTNELYEVVATVDEFPHGGRTYLNVELVFFVHDRGTEEPPVPYEQAIEDYAQQRAGEARYAEGAILESFTLEEAVALQEWLAEHYGLQADIRRIALPIPANRAGVGAQDVGGAADFYVFSKHEEYSLPFEAWAYFDVSDCQVKVEPEDAIVRLLQDALAAGLQPGMSEEELLAVAQRLEGQGYEVYDSTAWVDPLGPPDDDLLAALPPEWLTEDERRQVFGSEPGQPDGGRVIKFPGRRGAGDDVPS